MSWILPLSNVTATVTSPCLPMPVPSVVIGAAESVAAKRPPMTAAAILVRMNIFGAPFFE